MILKCKCKHEYQDQRYGKEQRVHNPLKKEKMQSQKWRCSVCENVINGDRNYFEEEKCQPK